MYIIKALCTAEPCTYSRGCVKMMHPLFRYIIIVLPFFIEYDLCFSYVHAFWGYNVL